MPDSAIRFSAHTAMRASTRCVSRPRERSPLPSTRSGRDKFHSAACGAAARRWMRVLAESAPVLERALVDLAGLACLAEAAGVRRAGALLPQLRRIDGAGLLALPEADALRAILSIRDATAHHEALAARTQAVAGGHVRTPSPGPEPSKRSAIEIVVGSAAVSAGNPDRHERLRSGAARDLGWPVAREDRACRARPTPGPRRHRFSDCRVAPIARRETVSHGSAESLHAAGPVMPLARCAGTLAVPASALG